MLLSVDEMKLKGGGFQNDARNVTCNFYVTHSSIHLFNQRACARVRACACHSTFVEVGGHVCGSQFHPVGPAESS